MKRPKAMMRASPRGRPDLMLEQQMPGIVAGIDEVGRGPLAGPVVAACVVLPALLAPEMAAMLDDSKRLSADQRGAALAALRASAALIGIGAASVLEIERLNILQASLLAMRRAFAHLTPRPDAALVDGNRDPGLGVPTRCVVAGDSLSLSIAAASIVAKQCRDRAMSRLDARYPGYGWAQNAGYGAPAHLAGLRSRGVTPHHRAGFGTVRAILGG